MPGSSGIGKGFAALKSSASLRALAVMFYLGYICYFAYSAVGVPVIGCNITSVAGGCAHVPVLYIENESGGYMNAHAQSVSVANYSWEICCNTTQGSLGTGCNGSNFIDLSAEHNAHVQYPGAAGGTYTHDACINHTHGKPICFNTTDSCPADSTCMFSYASSEGNNATNAHVGSCDEYVSRICCRMNYAPYIDTMILNSTSGTNTSSEDLKCYVNATDNDNATIDIYFQWWKDGSFDSDGSVQVSRNELTLVATLDSSNTAAGEVWNCSAKSGDGSVNQSWWENRTLTINTPPAQPAVMEPWGIIHQRFTFFNWTASNDTDGDDITYILNITCMGGCSDDNRIITGITHDNYTLQEKLKYFSDDSYTYNWSVLANDGKENSTGGRDFNISLASTVILALDAESVDMGTLNPNNVENTSDGSPQPFVLENQGNCMNDVNISAQQLFSRASVDSSYYQFKADNESGSENVLNVNWTDANTTGAWTNMHLSSDASSQVKWLDYFNWTNQTDTIELDLQVRVPSDEPFNNVGSIITITGYFVSEDYG